MRKWIVSKPFESHDKMHLHYWHFASYLVKSLRVGLRFDMQSIETPLQRLVLGDKRLFNWFTEHHSDA